MLKRMSVIEEGFQFEAEASDDGEYATVTLTSVERDVAEIYVSHKELKAIIRGAIYILNELESFEGETQEQRRLTTQLNWDA